MRQAWETTGQVPRAPGVYFLVSTAGELLYIGKAPRLDRRLAEHRRAAERGQRPRLYGQIGSVAWEAAPTARAAEWREADLVVALRPPYNRALTSEGRWNYIVLSELASGRYRISLTSDPGSGDLAYGCFPHLGRGVSSPVGTACSDGYAACLRLLWAASSQPGRMPSAITRAAPDSVEVEVHRDQRRALRDLLAGVSPRLLEALAIGSRQRRLYASRSLERDVAAARRFFEAGPRRMRDLRRRHQVTTRTLTRAQIEVLLAREVEDVIGPFRHAAPIRRDPRRAPR